MNKIVKELQFYYLNFLINIQSILVDFSKTCRIQTKLDMIEIVPFI